MSLPRLTCLLAVTATLLSAAPDPAALLREHQELDSRNTRENQRIEEAQEEALIPVRARVRDLKSKAERALQAAGLALASAQAAGKPTVDTAALEQAKFDELEADNLDTNELTPAATDPFELQRQAWARQYDLLAAKIDVKLYDGMEGGEKARDQTLRKAELTAKWLEKLQALDLEAAKAERKLNREYTTRSNRAEARLFALGARASVAMNARVQARLKKGEVPTAEDTTPRPEPEQAAVEAERDDARNGLQTALEKCRAEFTPRRNELENQRDEELAKLGT